MASSKCSFEELELTYSILENIRRLGPPTDKDPFHKYRSRDSVIVLVTFGHLWGGSLELDTLKPCPYGLHFTEEAGCSA